MPILVSRYQETPNPNAIKCFLSAPISSGPRSFRRPEEGVGDATAEKLFAVPGVLGLLFGGDWLTVNKASGSTWGPIKRGIERALAGVDAAG